MLNSSSELGAKVDTLKITQAMLLVASTLLPMLSKAACATVMAIVPMRVPRFYQTDIRGQLYISSSVTKFLEQARIDWVPVDLSTSDSINSTISAASGVLLPHAYEAYSEEEDISWYRKKVELVVEIVKQINASRFFPVLGFGFGAQLLTEAISGRTMTPSSISAAVEKVQRLVWSDQAQLFEQTFPEKHLIKNVTYPFSSLYGFSADQVQGNPWYRANAVTWAHTVTSTNNSLIAAFEMKDLPLLSIFFDVHRLQFFSDQTYQVEVSLASQDAAFAFALGISRLLRRGSCQLEYVQVLKKQEGWSWMSFSSFAGEFTDFYYH